MRTDPIQGRTTAGAEGNVVVFLIGIRVNRFRSPRSWWPSIYGNMPAYGLARATGVVPVSRRGETAGQRLGLDSDG